MMAQTYGSLILSLTLLATTTVASVTAQAADAPATCLEAYRKASSDYWKDAQGIENTLETTKYIGGAAGIGTAVSLFTQARVGGLIVGGILGGIAGTTYVLEKRRLTSLEDSTKVLSIYENVLNSGGDTDIPEGQDLLKEAAVDKQNEKAVLAELVKMMESGKLCDRDKSPKALGDIVAELKDYERTQVRAIY